MWVQSLDGKDPLEEEMATHSSILPRRIPWTEKPERLQSKGVAELDTTEVTQHTHTHTHTHTHRLSCMQNVQQNPWSLSATCQKEPPPSYDIQKCLQTWPHVSWGAKSPLPQHYQTDLFLEQQLSSSSSAAAAAAKSLQLCPTLCDPIDGSPTGSPVPGILQARTLEWVAISFSNA